MTLTTVTVSNAMERVLYIVTGTFYQLKTFITVTLTMTDVPSKHVKIQKVAPVLKISAVLLLSRPFSNSFAFNCLTAIILADYLKLCHFRRKVFPHIHSPGSQF